MDHLHPESYRQLRALVRLHGSLMINRAVREIENQLVSEYEAAAREAMARSIADDQAREEESQSSALPGDPA